MEFSQYTWDLYKQSKNGKKVIEFFDKDNIFLRDIEAIKLYNPIQYSWISKKEYQEILDILSYNVYYDKIFEDYNDFQDFSNVRNFYTDILEKGIFDREDSNFFYINPKEYDFFLQINVTLSFFFYQIAPEFCIPNLFIYRFFDLNKIADVFNIELPPIPKKSNYKARCMYYLDLCEVFYNFRMKSGLTPSELCAFIYDFAPNYIKKEMSNMPKPAQAWFIGGKTSEEEEILDYTFWQGNAETKKGDILIHYETSPISAITCIWIAQTDGVIDPFFHYYSNVYIGNKIKVPHITLNELRADKYFSKHPLIRKNFQGVNGWTVSNNDYNQLIRLFQNKNFDIERLPKLYSSHISNDLNLKNERDVELNLLEPYLTEIGLQESTDYKRQLPIKAGRGKRIYPDYALHYTEKQDYESAKILIEVKYHMKNNKDIEECFKQARSYANILESSVIILCDKNCLIIYKRNNGFDRNNYNKIYWEELKNPDIYNQLRKIIYLK